LFGFIDRGILKNFGGASVGEKLFEVDVYPPESKINSHVFPERVQQFKNNLERNLAKIKEWEYCYCSDCKKIKFVRDLRATEEGICCTECGNTNLEPPDWVNCPHHKDSFVKCPRGGKGIRKLQHGSACLDNCYFRT
jgi:hypothetical protein